MKKILIILIFGSRFLCAQIDCEKYFDSYVPQDIHDAITFLDCKWSESDKLEYKNQDEELATSNLHFGAGLAIRNGWGLWKGNSGISKYFLSKGIFHPDDMSSIILTSFHRSLNNRPILLEGQIKCFLTFWENSLNSEKIVFDSLNQVFRDKFMNLYIGDTVEIEFKIEHRFGSTYGRRVQQYPEIEEECNCKLEGIVKRKKVKRKRDFYGKYMLHVNLLETCQVDEIVFMMESTTLKQNKTYRFFNLDNYRITLK